VAVDTRRPFENALPRGDSFTGLSRLALVLNPAVELIARLHIDAQKHLGMLGSAILRALP
jgi:hypothetical protein